MRRTDKISEARLFKADEYFPIIQHYFDLHETARSKVSDLGINSKKSIVKLCQLLKVLFKQEKILQKHLNGEFILQLMIQQFLVNFML